LHRIRVEQAILYVSSQNGSFLMDGLVGESVLTSSLLPWK